MTLPKHVTDALEILLITKDNLAGYHRELVEHFILEDWWGIWIGRWTAEEHLHAIVLREYLVVTRDIDPVANEDVRVEHVMKGYRADNSARSRRWSSWRCATRQQAVFCRRLADQIDDPTLRRLIELIAVDEERHTVFFDNLVARVPAGSSRRRRSPRSPHVRAELERRRRATSTRTRTRSPLSPTRAFSDENCCGKSFPTRLPPWGLVRSPRAGRVRSLSRIIGRRRACRRECRDEGSVAFDG